MHPYFGLSVKHLYCAKWYKIYFNHFTDINRFADTIQISGAQSPGEFLSTVESLETIKIVDDSVAAH